MLLHLLNSDVGIVNAGTDPINHLTHVVGRDIGGHTHRDSGSPVD